MAEENTQLTYWISGLIGGKQVDCGGPFTAPVDEDMYHHYPFTTVAPNSNYQYQKFDYMKNEWQDMSTETLANNVSDLQTSVKTINTALQATQAKQKTATQSNSQLSDQIGNLTKMITLTNANLGQVMQAVNSLKTTQGGNN